MPNNKFKIGESGILISVIVPAYNEEQRLPNTLHKTITYLNNHFSNTYELIVVDDGSTDRTVEIAEKTKGVSSVIRQQRNQGKGAAVRRGVLEARGQFILFTDADGATPIEEESKLRKAIEQGAAIAIGSRHFFAGGIQSLRLFKTSTLPSMHRNENSKIQIHRRLIGKIFSLLVRTAFGLPVHDTQCGFKMFRSNSAKAVFPLSKVDGFAFDVEILLIAHKLGFSIREVLVQWSDVEGSKVRIFRDAMRMAMEIRRISHLHKDIPMSENTKHAA